MRHHKLAIAAFAALLAGMAVYLLRSDDPGDEDSDEVTRELRSGKRLQLHRVVIAPVMKDLPDAQLDDWLDESNAWRHDYYLQGERAALEQQLSTIVLPAGTHVAFELQPPLARNNHVALWRSYVLEDAVAFDDARITKATASQDPTSFSWQVAVELDAEGTRAFADLTRRHAGQKLAIVYGGDVMSAPIILEPIVGGRFAFYVGGSDRKAEERTARVIAGALTRRAREARR